LSAPRQESQTKTVPGPKQRVCRLLMVATPIGNLEDLSLRAVRCLTEADIIACEDTRHTAKLLAHLGLSKACVSIHEHNEQSAGERLLSRALEQGQTIAYVSDAGTPGVSDPGCRLAAMAHTMGIPVYAIAGPSAWASAVSVAGFAPPHHFFVGFFPRSPTESAALLRRVLTVAPCQLVFFESPHRVARTLELLQSHLPGHTRVCVCREITKVFESTRVFTLDQALNHLNTEPIRGEFVVIIEVTSEVLEHSQLHPSAKSRDLNHVTDTLSLSQLADQALANRSAALTLRDMARHLAKAHPRFTSREIYQAALQTESALDSAKEHLHP
jgi:16S rRNA (cytidine1402-2'-O)-methyltransferase